MTRCSPPVRWRWRTGQATFEWLGAGFAVAALVMAFVALTPGFGGRIDAGLTAAVCRLVGKTCPVDPGGEVPRPQGLDAVISVNPARAIAPPPKGPFTARQFAATDGAGPEDLVDNSFGDASACETLGPSLEVCLGSDGRANGCASEGPRWYCTADAIPVGALECAPAPNALRADALTPEQLCHLPTDDGDHSFILRCVDAQLPTRGEQNFFEGCQDTNLDGFARPASALVNPASCQGAIDPAGPQPDAAEADPVREGLGTEHGVTTVRDTWLCSTWGGSVMSCWDVTSSTNPGWVTLPGTPTCDNRSPGPQLVDDCQATETPNLSLCATRRGERVLCAMIDGPQHCATRAASGVVRKLVDGCPTGRRRLQAGKDGLDQFTLAFCLALAPTLARMLANAGQTIGLSVSPTGQVVQESSANPNGQHQALLAAAHLAHVGLAGEAGAFPPPVVVIAPPESIATGEVFLVSQPDGSVTFASEQALVAMADQHLPADHVALSLPPGQPVALWTGPPAAPGTPANPAILVVNANATPDQLLFGQALAWVANAVPGFSSAQQQVLAALVVSADPSLVEPRLRALLNLGRGFFRPRTAWQQVVLLLSRNLRGRASPEGRFGPALQALGPRAGPGQAQRFIQAFERARFSHG